MPPRSWAPGAQRLGSSAIPEGVVAHAEWEYTREQVPQARAALLADRRYEVVGGGTRGKLALERARASSTCSVSVMEEPQPVIWTMAHPGEEN